MRGHPADGEMSPESAGDGLSGKVLETISVPNYTYLRIEPAAAGAEKSKNGIWAAVATADVKVGQSVSVVGAQRMENFTSSTLKRTFEVIYFGALGGAAQANSAPDNAAQVGASSNLPPGHPDISGNAMAAPIASAVGNNPHADLGRDGSSPHGSPSGGDDVPVAKVARASGPLGHTVAEIVNGRRDFAGKKVRIRGVVVKSTSGVLGKTFLHLRDGSGSSKSGDHDLTVTTEQAATVGSTMLVEGTVITDKDFGAGYSYPVLVEDAQTVAE